MARWIPLFAVLGGCIATAPGASLEQLHHRASLDMRCDALSLSHLDARTRVVRGCGAESVYVESCEHIRGSHACTWLLDAVVTRAPAPADPARTPRTSGQAVAVPLPAVDSQHGDLTVNAAGGDCRVRISTIEYGSTPALIRDLEPGTTLVECRANDGRLFARHVEVARGRTTRVSFRLAEYAWPGY